LLHGFCQGLAKRKENLGYRRYRICSICLPFVGYWMRCMMIRARWVEGLLRCNLECGERDIRTFLLVIFIVCDISSLSIVRQTDLYIFQERLLNPFIASNILPVFLTLPILLKIKLTAALCCSSDLEAIASSAKICW